MDVLEAIKSRRTIRRFDEKKRISLDILKTLINAGRLAPSAANLQPWEFIVVNDRAKCEEIFPYLKWAGYLAPEGTPGKGEHPVSYIVLVANIKINQNFQHDFGAAAQNIMLAAYNIGIGSCWMGAIDRDQIREILNVSEQYQIDTLVALGYPKEKSVMEEAKDSIKYYKDKNKNLHVPKRPLKKIVHINRW